MCYHVIVYLHINKPINARVNVKNCKANLQLPTTNHQHGDTQPWSTPLNRWTSPNTPSSVGS